MIARLEGTILSADEGVVLLNVGGVGFAVQVPSVEGYRSGKQGVFFTYLHVRENELALYGFPDSESQALFELLLGVSGVGPKAALSVMGTLDVPTLQQAIANRQPEVLSRAPGVGRKTAEAIILHLKDRLASLRGPLASLAEDDADVVGALTALGFSVVEAQRALQQLPGAQELSVEEKIRRALSLLSK